MRVLCVLVFRAGGGGFYLLGSKNCHNDIKNSINVKTWVNVKFSDQGSQLIFVDS